MKSRHFSAAELVAPELLAVLCEYAAWRLVSPYTPALDLIRDMAGMVIEVNSDGRKYCGVRPANCPEGAPLSRHKGAAPELQAFDLHCADLAKLEQIVRQHSKQLGIARIENPKKTPGWLHIELLPHPTNADLVVFDP